MTHHREWDRGKDSWGDAYAWSGQDDRPIGRDHDDYGEGKRRKFNNGVRVVLLLVSWGLLIQNGPKGYDTTRGFEDNTTYSDSNRQHDWSQDRGQEDRSRGGGGNFPKKRLVPSEPSPHVIFLGLDPDFTEADVCRLPCS